MPKKPLPIHVMITGGTIDSIDQDIRYPMVPQEKSIVPHYVKSLKLDNKIKFTLICFKDSRDISRDDLKNLLTAIRKTSLKNIIITIGTFAMPDVSRFLELNLNKKNKTIVLTGSMIPIYGFPLSDGPFNLGYAVSQVQILKNDVYVCMNGKTLTSKEVMKAVDEGKFVSILE